MTNKSAISGGMLTALMTISSSTHALDKPQTMEDMWKIIQAQQKQIDALMAEKQVTKNTPPVTEPVVSKAAPPSEDVKKEDVSCGFKIGLYMTNDECDQLNTLLAEEGYDLEDYRACTAFLLKQAGINVTPNYLLGEDKLTHMD